MRSSRHMMSMAGVAAALAVVTESVAFANSSPPREPRKVTPTRQAIRDTGKPPTNGSREVARRLRQMQRAAVKREGK